MLQIFQQLNGIFRSEILIDPLAVDLHHGCIGTGSKTLDFLDGVHVVRSGLSIFDTEVFFACGDDIFGPSQLAGCGAADLEMVFAYSLSVEHGVEGGDLIDVHFVDFCYFGHFAHG